MTKDDLTLVKEFTEYHNISLLNTRAFKKFPHHFIISIGSIDTSRSRSGIKFKGNIFDLEYGEFASYLKTVNHYLKLAKQFASNKVEEKMIDLYMKHFESGDIEDHKDS